jgi:hypothetical protein
MTRIRFGGCDLSRSRRGTPVLSLYRPVRMRLLVPLAGAALAASCGGHAATYAGMTKYEAATEAADIIADESVKMSSDISGLHPTLSKMVRDEYEPGKEAWVGVFKTEGPRICVWVWADTSVMSTTYNYDYGRCPKKILRAKGELGAPTS